MFPYSPKLITAAAAIAAMLAAVTPLRAEMINLVAHLKGADETPPNTTTGTGELKGTYDTATKKLTWTVTYSGLTGPANAAHFHGPADPGTPAPVVVPAPVEKSPIEGSEVLTDEVAKELLSGKVYFNIHTEAHKPGEIRGQVEKAS